MKLGLLSDIHGNLPAFRSCLKKLEDESADSFLCLGDTVGYGPWPNECLNILREKNIPSVLGNHDACVIGKLSLKFFREPNAGLLKKTTEILSDANRNYLLNVPYTIQTGRWLAVHSSPSEPEKWHYLRSAVTCRKILENLDQQICFVGHTHVPGIVADQIGILTVQEGHKYVINPGSVGQSRDKDKRASCGLFDTETCSYHNFRVEYPIDETLRGYGDYDIKPEDARKLLHL